MLNPSPLAYRYDGEKGRNEMTNKEKYEAVQSDFDKYITKNKNRNFYFDKILTRFLDKYELSLKDYYNEGRKEER